jgi:hypothetical protein
MESLIATIQELLASRQMVVTDIKATRAGYEEIKARIEAGQEERKATVSAIHEKIKAMINSIRSELEETIKNWVENGLDSVDQWTQGIRERLNVKFQLYLGLQAR